MPSSEESPTPAPATPPRTNEPDRSATADRSLSASLKNIGETFKISAPTVLDALLGRVTMAACDARLASWSQRLCDHAGIKLHVEGREHLQPGQTYVVMSNHESLYDIPVMFVAMGTAGARGNLRMVTKTELFRIPIFGAAMKNAGFVEIDRKNRQRAIESLAEAKQKLAGGTHVWISPEGTRSTTGELQPFKKGPFQLALDAMLPVLPAALIGTRQVFGEHGWRTTRGIDVKVILSAPLDPAPYRAMPGKTGRDVLARDVRAIIEASLERGRTGS
jgi:1-acyl-sn-glycerol-3-phosphate acyltransferase